MKIHGRDVQLGTSIGIAFDDGGQSTMGNVLRNADVALYRSKRKGGSTVSVFDPTSMDESTDAADEARAER
jgi:GGDEF domain-containing protein